MRAARLKEAVLSWLLDPVDPYAVGVMRVALGLLLLSGHAWLWPEVDRLLGPEADIPFSAIQGWSAAHRHSLYNLVETAAQARALHVAGFVVFGLFTIGWQSRIMGVLSLVLLVSVHQRMPWMQHGGDRLLRLWTLYLCFVPCGAALSVDAWWARRRGRPAPVLPAVAHRLVQVQLCVMYGMTALAKASGSQWLAGTALYYALAVPHFQRLPALSEALVESGLVQVVLVGATWLTLAWEAAFPLLVWFRRTRPAMLWLGVLVHGGIFLLMTVGSFSPASLWAYLAFVEPQRLGALGRRLEAALGLGPPTGEAPNRAGEAA